MRTKSLFTCLGAVPLRAGRRRVLPALIAVLSLIPAGRVTAQTFTTLYSFNGSSDGANPEAGLTVAADGKTRYGTTANGGNGGWGTVFAINTDGTGFTNLHSFNYSDGANPWAGLVLSGHTLYGTASNGGDRGAGTVFAINTDGTGFTNLHGFTPVVDLRCRSDLDCPDGYTCTDNPNGIAVCSSSNGAYPNAGLILSGNTLYGTASGGGLGGYGAVFAVSTDGTGFTNVHNFASYDGGDPVAGLILSGNTLYGTAAGGGNWGNGTVFAVNTDGTGFTNLHNFTQQIIPCLNGSCPPGYHCVAGICVPIPVYGCPGGCYPGYCVCVGDRDGNNIDCYCVGNQGTGPYRRSLIRARQVAAQTFVSINFDGAFPYAGLILSGNTLYGTAAFGGSWGHGTVFAVNTDGGGLTVLHNFTGGIDGANPIGGLILSGNTLYGTADSGGSWGLGTGFAVNTDGAGFTNLHSFTGGIDGANPVGDLILSGNTLYGTTRYGGSSGFGTAFSLPLPPLPPVAKCKNVTVSADANCSADASIDDGSFSPNAGGTISLVQSPSGPYLLGDTSVTLTVTDNHGASNSCVATVTVLDTTPCLIALVQSLRLPSGTANSLIVKLQAAASALDRGNIQAACGSLSAFLNEVNAQEGKKLTAAQADLLKAEATRIRAVLGCS